MSSEQRQREIREQGSQPREAQKQEEARTAHETVERANAELAASQDASPDEPTPLAEEAEDRPTPRR
jgi:hypothetical protein